MQMNNSTLSRFGLSLLLAGSVLSTLAAESTPQAPPLAMPGTATQTPPMTNRSAGIVIVPSLEKPNNARKLEEKDFAGYLMVYFKDQTHSAYLAVSRDGYTFTDLNGGEPIFDGTLLAEQKGVRDPHIARGPDGGFYLAMTDLHIFGQRAGFRTNTVGAARRRNTAGETTAPSC